MKKLIDSLMKTESKISQLQYEKREITKQLLSQVINEREFDLLKLDVHKLRKDYWERYHVEKEEMENKVIKSTMTSM